jgi:hypothetical protein
MLAHCAHVHKPLFDQTRISGIKGRRNCKVKQALLSAVLGMYRYTESNKATNKAWSAQPIYFLGLGRHGDLPCGYRGLRVIAIPKR